MPKTKLSDPRPSLPRDGTRWHGANIIENAKSSKYYPYLVFLLVQINCATMGQARSPSVHGTI